MFEFQRVNKSTLTNNWGLLNGNEYSPGIIRIGGAAFSGTPIAIGSSGSIALVTLKVTCSSCINDDTSQITIDGLTDDISLMTVSPSSVTFTYTE